MKRRETEREGGKKISSQSHIIRIYVIYNIKYCLKYVEAAIRKMLDLHRKLSSGLDILVLKWFASNTLIEA